MIRCSSCKKEIKDSTHTIVLITSVNGFKEIRPGVAEWSNDDEFENYYCSKKCLRRSI